jgi:hypothetical protein
MQVADAHALLARNITLDQRIRDSQLFPRIRDAQIEMKENERAFLEKLHLKKDRAKRLKAGTMVKRVEKVVNEAYFSSHVLNKDPAASKYLPYDEVYFPKLFNETHGRTDPAGLDTVWIMALKDMEIRNPLKAKAKAEKAKKKVARDAAAAVKARRFNMYES